MTRLLLSGYYGFSNAGDEAILAGIIQAVRELDPSVAFTVISGKRRMTAERYGVDAVSRGDLDAIWGALGSADALLSGGGSLLQDVTSFKSLSYYLAIMVMAKLRRKPAMVYAQGIGPITGATGRLLVRTVLNRMDAIAVRDPESAQLLSRLGITRPPVSVTADAALVLGPGDPELGRSLLRPGLPETGPLVGVSVRPWKAGDARFVPALAEALDGLTRASGGHVVFFPMQVPGDVQAAEAVRTLMKERATVLTESYTHQEVRGLVAATDLVIGLRYHALVFAAMSGVPMVGLSYDPKIDSFLRLLGREPAATTDRLDSAQVQRAAERALAEGPGNQEKLLQRVAELAVQARENARLALQIAEKRR